MGGAAIAGSWWLHGRPWDRHQARCLSGVIARTLRGAYVAAELRMSVLFETSTSWAITVVRVILGVIVFAHGAQKVFGWFGGYGLKGTTGYFVSIGLPLPVAYVACFMELLGGIGLVLGLFTRLAALAVIGSMAGAIAKVHAPHGFFINWELTPGKGHGVEANLAFIAMAVACLIAGGGALSLDLLLMR